MKHLSVTEHVERLLKENAFSTDSPISIKSISEELNLNPRTVRKGLKPFLDNDILRNVKGKGIYPKRTKQYSKHVVCLVAPVDGHFYNELTNRLVMKLSSKNIFSYIKDHEELRADWSATLEQLLAQEPKSVILDASIFIPQEFIDMLKPVRTIIINDYETSDTVPGSGVLIDFEEGSFAATRHFAGLGYENIVMATPQPREEHVNFQYRQRLSGYRRALKDVGLGKRENVLWWKRHDGQDSDKELHGLLEGFGSRCAFVCSSDWTAVEIMKSVRETGRRIPEDVAFIGFYDTPWTEYAPVSLSSMCVNIEELTDLAVDLATSDSDKEVVYKICPKIKLRNSCPKK